MKRITTVLGKEAKKRRNEAFLYAVKHYYKK